MAARTNDGRPFRILTIIDEYTRECLAIKVARSIRSHDVLDCLADLCMMKGVPEHIRSDNGPELTARVVRSWIGRASETGEATEIKSMSGRPFRARARPAADKNPARETAEDTARPDGVTATEVGERSSVAGDPVP